MSEPRFLIVPGRTQLGISSPEWPTAEDPFAVLNRPDGDWFSWRLLSGNNRELGRGASAYQTPVGCLAAVTRIQIRSELCTSVAGVRAPGQWWWQLELEGERIAVAGRGYQRQRECRYNLEQFMIALPLAQQPTSSVRGRPEDSAARLTVSLAPPVPTAFRVVTPTERLRRTRAVQ